MKLFNKIKDFLKTHAFVWICFLTTLPLIALGIWGIITYQPQSVWQRENIGWIRPICFVLLVIIIEFVVVCLPFIMFRHHNNYQDPTINWKRTNFKKELSFNLASNKLAIADAKQKGDRLKVRELHKQKSSYRKECRRQLKALKLAIINTNQAK